jgi:UDP-N-acetylglucosamine diphosphorylase/glucosamine-1-phosphate N-acetyltransferase
MFDDLRARDWQPFTLTRPAGELLFGAHTLRARAELVAGAQCIGHIADQALAGFAEPGTPRTIAIDTAPRDEPRLFLLSRAVPAWQQPPHWPAATARVLVGGQPAGWYVPAGAIPPNGVQLIEQDSYETEGVIELAGVVLENVWDLIARSPAQTADDIRAERARRAPAAAPPSHVEVIGSRSDVLLGSDVTIEPGVVLDASHGPLWLDDGVTLRAFTRLAGPSYIGRGTTVLGGPLAEVSIGPLCKVHGEIEASIILGCTNKAHDGFLGHAYLGKWVNLGALTTNSDLKNNYGTIRLWTPAGEVDTGEMKIGCLLGDHVKTGIGTMLNTGTVVGAGSNLFGSAMPPKYVPPFSWGSGSDLATYEVEKFMATAETVMQRRNLTLDADQRALLERAWQRTRAAT